MKNFFEKIQAFFAMLGTKLKPKPKDVSAVNEPPATPRAPNAKRKVDRFTMISWVATIFIVVTLLGSTVLYKNSEPPKITTVAIPTNPATDSGADQPQMGEPAISELFIMRKLQLITHIPERPRYKSVVYRVSRGDAMLSIADDYKIKTDSILFANTELDDNPHSLKPGMELIIPPVDGIYYKWKEGDTFESVAAKFDANADDIINFSGNNIDLTDPNVALGALVMVPDGTRELRNWAADLQTQGRGANTGTGGANAGNACGGGPVGGTFGWPASSQVISGYGYMPSHLGLDIQADEGEPIYAAGSGIVTQASDGWNYGYGKVIQIDHGNGYVTVYAHLSVINVGICTPVGQGTVIGAAGSSGNAFGAHLHFEVRIGGANVNPYSIVQ